MFRSNHRTASLWAGICALALFACTAKTDSNHPPDEPPPVARKFDPTVARTPKPSKSLSLAPDWSPPSPTRSKSARMKARVEHPKQYGVPTPAVPELPTDAELRALTRFAEPLRPMPGASSDEETAALAAALREESRDDRGTAALERFLEAYPTSRWAPALHLNIGSVSYSTGYFQDALTHWKAAWDLAKAGEDAVSLDLANLGLAESAKMNARIGRVTEVESLLKEAETRNLMGDARVKIGGAAEGAWTMRHRPEIAFRCGPYALLNVAQELKPEVAKKSAGFLEKTRSPLEGFSVPEVHRMSSELGVQLQIAKRERGAAVVVPAVVHWRVGHFGAILRAVNDSYLLKDPTFGNDTWLTREALDREATGYFLVPSGPLPPGWTRATTAETAELYGKGFTDGFPPDETGGGGGGGPDCAGSACCAGGGPGPGPGPGPDPGGPEPGLPMAIYWFHPLLASLHIEDTPVGYRAAIGPDVRVRLAYNQREAAQPTTIDFTSFG